MRRLMLTAAMPLGWTYAEPQSSAYPRRKAWRSWAVFAARIVTVFCLTLGLQPANSYAFKLETHVWIAQEVLNDILADGRVTIVFRDAIGNLDPREFVVDPALVEALRKYPNEFRMGAIGGDAFPDMIAGQLTVHPGTPGGWQSDQWLRWVMDSAPKPTLGTPSRANLSGLINGREAAFAFGYLVHAAGDIFAHTYINSYVGDIFDVTDVQPEGELRHIALEEYIEKHDPPFRDQSGALLGRPETLVNAASVAGFIRNTLILNSTVADQYRKQNATAYLAGLYDFWKAQGDILANVKAAEAQVAASFASILGDIDGVNNRIAEASDFLSWCPFSPVPIPGCLETFGTLKALQLSLALLRNSLSSIQSLQAHLADRVTAPLTMWRLDVEEALRQYVLTSQEVAKAIMRADLPNLGEQDKAPAKLKEWMCRWAPTFALVPSPVTAIGCIPRQQLAQIQDGIDAVRVEISDKLGVLGWVVDPMIKVDQLIDEKLDEGLFTRLTELMADDNSVLVSLARLRERPDTPADMARVLNAEFALDSSNKHLLQIPDAAFRVELDMNAVPGGPFDPDTFAPVHNALVLSKLVLLGSIELNRLVRGAGVSDTIYGASLFAPSPSFNILFDAVRSIDGNHQWQEFALPYPRSSGTDPGWFASRQYGYPFDGYKGFRLWQDCEVREQVFERIFRGPIAPSLMPIAGAVVSGWESAADPFPLSAASKTPPKWRIIPPTATRGATTVLVCGTAPLRRQ